MCGQPPTVDAIAIKACFVTLILAIVISGHSFVKEECLLCYVY